MALINTIRTQDVKDKPKRVVFTGDFIRPSREGKSPTQHHNIRWLRNLLSSQIGAATGLQSDVVAWNHSGLRDGGFGRMDIQRIYRAFGVDVSLKSWATIYEQDRLPATVEALFDVLFRESLVVGFELPPYLENFLSRRGIPFVGVTMHPVRFLDDIFFGMRSNIASVQERVLEHRISEAYIKTMAGIQKAAAARYFPSAGLKQNSALFLLQTWYDQSQIRQGRFVAIDDYLSSIAKIARGHSELLVKEHPLAPNPRTHLLKAYIPNLRMVQGNTYAYLALPEVTRVVTISSSTGVESRYFGVNTSSFLGDPVPLRIGDSYDKDAYIGVFDAFLTTDFWRDVLNPVLPVTQVDGAAVPAKPNRLRISMQEFWGFNQIDTDVTHALLG